MVEVKEEVVDAMVSMDVSKYMVVEVMKILAHTLLIEDNTISA